MRWKTVELQADYWIILADDDGYTEYVDDMGDNLMFESEQQAQDFIKSIGAKDGNVPSNL